MTALLKIVAALGLAAAVLALSLLLLGQEAGNRIQQRFFFAVTNGDAEALLTEMHPKLREQIDPPVLELWMRTVNERLGKVRETTVSRSTVTEIDGQAGRLIEGNIAFERGDARARLITIDGLVREFDVHSPSLPQNWLSPSLSTELYRQRGRYFLERFLANDTESVSRLMHPALRREWPVEALARMMADVDAECGSLQQMTIEGERFRFGQEKKLEIEYRLECSSTTLRPVIEFRFDLGDWRGHLTGLQFHRTAP